MDGNLKIYLDGILHNQNQLADMLYFLTKGLCSEGTNSRANVAQSHAEIQETTKLIQSRTREQW